MTSGNWAGSSRRAELPANWNALRERVFARDGHYCTFSLPSGKRCPRRANQVDHIDNSPSGRLNHDQANLRSLCRTHHQQVTLAQAKAGRAKKKQGRPRREQRAPGVVQ